MTRLPATRGNKYKAVGVMACRRCRMIVARKPKAERENPTRKWDEDRMQDWHTPGHPDHDCDGTPVRLDSKLEARTWLALCEAEDSGLIQGLERQPAFELRAEGGTKIGTYRADFRFVCGGRERVVDAKGFRTPLYRFKKRFVEAAYNVEIEEWKRGTTAL